MIYGERARRAAFRVSADGLADRMERVPYMAGSFNEAWLQQLIAENPDILPTGEIGADYSPLVCIGREVEVGASGNHGYIDNLYVTPTGHVVIVETKLFRNQEARRLVIAQIIEYAKELQKWDAEKLNAVASDYFFKQTGQAANIIDEMAKRGYLTFSDESALNDAINRYLSEASFLLLIVGDGIRSNVFDLAEFLNDNTSMKFNLGLVEIETYQDGDGFICVPNLLTKTTVIERRQPFATLSIYRDKDIIPTARIPYQTKPILSRAEFADTFARNGGLDSDDFLEFINDLDALIGARAVILPTEIQLRVTVDGKSELVLLTFSISLGHADIWVVPGRVRSRVGESDDNRRAAEEFLEFYKSFVDESRCKEPPFEKAEGFYFADVGSVMDHADDFISAVERFSVVVSRPKH